MSPCPRIHFLLVRRVPPGLGPVLTEVCERLRERGALVSDSIPEETLLPVEEMAPGHELYVLKSHTELALSLAGSLVALGGRLLNSHRSCLLTQDKITANRLLAHAGVPVPESWITGDYRLLRSLLTQGPLIAKPHRGHRGEGILILRDAGDLDLISPESGPFIFQRYVSTGGEDLKAYVVGDEAFAVSKRFSPESFQIAGRPVELDPRTREIVLQCGRALGLELYGVDLIRASDGPVVVDVNYFPGYKGVPGAAKLIADHIHERAVAQVGERVVLEVAG